tara:strand:+ start:2701 stop:2946 length:246 start_codon:yes stop_codon:yes gene_type:complete
MSSSRLEKETKEELERAMTVADLISYLELIPDDLKVGVTGHFCEFHGMTALDFGIESEYVDGKVKRKWLRVEVPDIGEEPD